MVFEHSQLGIVLFDRRDFVIKEANLRFASMLNFSIAELQAMPFPALFFNAPEKGRFFEYIEKNGDIQDFETRLRTKEGHGCWVNLSWSAMDERVISVSAVDITARKLMEKVNQDTLLKYRELTENSPNGILVIQDGLVRSANPSFTSFSGFSVEEVAGKPLLHLVDPRDHDTCSTFFQQFEGNVPVADRTILRFVTKSGLLRTGVLFTNPTLHHGEPATMVNLVDISEQQRLEEKIHQDNERRRGIIITVAHELRTPLQPILGYLNLLVQDPEGFGILADAKKMLERCLVSVERERQIINQMLELSVLESGKLQLSYSSFSPANLVMSVIDASGYPAKAEVTLDIPADLIISADMDRLFSVIDSLMANAVNYSKPPRKIRIFYRPGRDGSTHTISVQDNGVGIAAEMFDSIFEPFQLADAVKLSRKYNRLGLSLSIAKKIIQMHRGSITLESVLNGGSTFTIHLPKEKPPDA
jgi:PAS domain S-box-containing protein